ncbi:MAG: HdeD family acid-resistance protein [Proteobacteria bacterium]|nr:HdeD family acid-resistance protein [Pseudomonadota bacterium]
MSGSAANAQHHGLGNSARITGKWGWFVALGIVCILAGFFALGDVVAFTLVSVIFIGAMLLVSGVFHLVHAFMVKTWGQVGLNAALGVLYVLGGFLIMNEPVQGSLVITLFLLAALVVGGVIRFVIAVSHRELAYWWLMALGGVLSVVVGVMLYMSMPWSSLWVLGFLIAIELIIQGVTWLQFGLALRRRHVG